MDELVVKFLKKCKRVQQVVDFAEVVEKIGDPGLREIRQDKLISPHDRQEDVFVEDGVEVVNPAVHRLPWVVYVECLLLFRYSVLLGGQSGGYNGFLLHGRSCAAGHQDQENEQRQVDSALHRNCPFIF